MRDVAAIWYIGGFTGAYMPGELSLIIFSSDTAFSEQWAKDFHNGLPVLNMNLQRLNTQPDEVTLQVSNKDGIYNDELMPGGTLLVYIGDERLSRYNLAFVGTVHDKPKSHGSNARGLTVHAKGWAQELKDTYDNVYGQIDGDTGAITNPTTHVGNLLPSGWDNLCTETALTRFAVTQGTSRRAAIQQVASIFGARFYGDNQKRLRWRSPSRDPVDDALCEADTNWGSDKGGSQTAVGAGQRVGTNKITLVDADVGEEHYRSSLAIDLVSHPILVMWYKEDQGYNLRLYTGAVYNASNYYSLADFGQYLTVAGWNLVVIRCPDGTGLQGWTANGSADYTTLCNRIAFVSLSVDGTGAADFDDIHWKGVGDTYPAWGPGQAQLYSTSFPLSREAFLSTVYMNTGAPGTPHTASFLGASAWGVREMVSSDHEIVDNEEAQVLAGALLLSRGLGFSSPSLSGPWLFPLNTWIQPGDGVTFTDANLGISNAAFFVDGVTMTYNVYQGTRLSLVLGRSIPYSIWREPNWAGLLPMRSILDMNVIRPTKPQPSPP